jgi:hypothetical protein
MICVERTGVYRILIGKPEAKRQPRKPERRWENNVKIYLKFGNYTFSFVLVQGRD